GSVQTAYQIRVAKNKLALEKGKHLLWKTGKVNSDKSTLVAYKGSALSSSERAYWQVRIWDNYGNVSDWSKPAYWEMGLLNTADWKASWITSGFKENYQKSNPSPYFRKGFRLKNKKIKRARIYATSLGLYQIFLDGHKVSDNLFMP